MTPEEAIELLKGVQSPLEDYAELVGAPAFAYGYEYVYPEPEDYAIEEAVKALKEIQQYREIGTVEELKNVGIVLIKRNKTLERMIDECMEYEKIGTVEECREAREKQIPKECIIDSCPDHTHYKCPSCGEILMSVYPRACGNGCITPYCKKCGQALRMENKDD